MTSVPQEIAPQIVDSVDITYNAKKPGKAKRLANKLRSSLSKKSRESIDSLDVGTPSPKESGKGRKKSKAKASLERKLSSSYKKLKKKLSREGKNTSSDDSVDMSSESGGSNSRGVNVDEFIERGKSHLAFQPVLQNTDVEVDSNADTETLKQELHFDVQPDGKMVEDVPENDDVDQEVVDSSECDSTTCPPTPDVADDKAKEASPPSDLGEDAVGTEPSVHYKPVLEEDTEEGSEAITLPDEILKRATETVETPEKTVEKASETVETVEVTLEKASETVEMPQDSFGKAVETPNEPMEKASEIDATVQEVVGKTAETQNEIVEIEETLQPAKTPETLVVNEELSSHVVFFESNSGEQVHSERCDGEKCSDAVLADEDVNEGVTIQSRALHLGDLDLGRGAGDAASASEDVETPVKAKRRSRARIFGAAGVAAGAVLFVARLAAAR